MIFVKLENHFVWKGSLDLVWNNVLFKAGPVEQITTGNPLPVQRLP